MQTHMSKPPNIFMVNWFRQGKDGKFLWPGFGENMRVLKWIVDRTRLRAYGQQTPFGWVPKAGDLDLSGLNVASDQVNAATDVSIDEWEKELLSQAEFFDKLGDALPKELRLQRDLMLARIERMRKHTVALEQADAARRAVVP